METARLMDNSEVAAWLGIQPATLEAWRRRGYGPTCVRFGPKCVRYERQVVEAWIEANREPARA